MPVIRRALSISTSALLLAGPVLAQDAAVRRAEGGPAVAASSTAAGVRFVAPGEARRVRLEVYAADGSRLFDSGFRAGGIYDWDGQGLADGSYLCVLTAEDIRGLTRRRLSSVAVASGRAALAKENEAELKASYAQALSAAGIESDDVLAAARAKKTNALTVTAHDGRDGQVTSTSGALTFRTGDVFSGGDREQMRVTPEGRVGIGTDTPEDTLDVAGTIRARGGIRFDDGTVLTSASALKSGTNLVANNTLVADGQTASGAAGTGTANRLSKWVDGAGTLGDSVVTESSGNLGVGTASPANRLDVVRGTPGLMAKGFYEAGSFEYSGDMKLGVYSSAPASPNAALTFGSTNRQVNSRFPGFELQYIYGATPAQNVMRFNYIERVQNGSVGAAAANVMTMKGNGEVTLNPVSLGLPVSPRLGIGTDAPQQALDVVGNVRVGGAGNGLIFPDGSKQTSAAASLGGANNWTGSQVFAVGLSANNAQITNVGNPVSAGDAVNKAYTDANFVKFVPGAEQLRKQVNTLERRLAALEALVQKQGEGQEK
jgi:hypothetical protein